MHAVSNRGFWRFFWSPTPRLCPRFLTQHCHATLLSCQCSVLLLSPRRSTKAWMRSARCAHYMNMLTRRLDSENQSSCWCRMLHHTWDFVASSSVVANCNQLSTPGLTVRQAGCRLLVWNLSLDMYYPFLPLSVCVTIKTPTTTWHSNNTQPTSWKWWVSLTCSLAVSINKIAAVTFAFAKI